MSPAALRVPVRPPHTARGVWTAPGGTPVHVVTRPIDPPVALVEQDYTDEGGCRQRLTVLVFRTGLLTDPVIRTLNRLLQHIR